MTGMFIALLHAQVVVTIDLQPLEAFRAALLGRLPGVALYSITACNLSPAARSIAAGQLVQASHERGIPVVSHRLNQVTAEAARRESRLYKTTRVFSWLAWGGGVFVAARPQVKAEYRAGAVAIAAASTVVSETFRSRGVDPSQIELLDTREVIQLGPYGQQNCANRLILGGYRRDPVQAVQIP